MISMPRFRRGTSSAWAEPGSLARLAAGAKPAADAAAIFAVVCSQRLHYSCPDLVLVVNGHRQRGQEMKIVIIGGTGLIGSKTTPILQQAGHEVLAASPKSGVNTITGEGLKQALAG